MNDVQTTRPLTGKRILVVEDEYYLADDLVQTLRSEGADVAGPAGTLAQAERLLAEGTIDCAILDINLRGEMAFPIADRLSDAGIPFLIASGYSSSHLPERFSQVPHFQKPYDPNQLLALVPHAMQGAAQGA
ncbi:MAG: response regulator [Alphaproteobacteria bacterium]|nr:response regulator [Alphaproteobacteria bacterium]